MYYVYVEFDNKQDYILGEYATTKEAYSAVFGAMKDGFVDQILGDNHYIYPVTSVVRFIVKKQDALVV